MSCRTFMVAVPALCLLAVVACAPLNGTGSGGEAKIIGRVITQTGDPACLALVTLAPHDYNAMISGPIPDSLKRMTDGNGRYEFSVIKFGTYTLQAVHGLQRTRALIAGIAVQQPMVVLPDAKLSVPGAIKIEISGTIDTVNGYAYIQGTDISSSFSAAAGGYLYLDSVPADTIPALYYSVRWTSVLEVIRYAVPVVSGDTTLITMPFWKYSRRLLLNTSASGSGVSGDVMNFPVLVRLTKNNFDFALAKADGGDSRFTKPDNTPLLYEIERWDSAAGGAEIWVRVDTVYGNNGTQWVTMFWGNPYAASASNSMNVFDTARGFQGVWHMAQAGNTTAQDATMNHFDGTPYGMSSVSAVAGAVGIAQDFDGSSSYIVIPNSASSKLDFPENGVYSISAWVYSDTITNSFHLIAGKGHDQYSLKLVRTMSGQGEKWEMNEYHDRTGWQICEDDSVTAKTWTYLTGVRNGTTQYLFVDGVLRDSAFWIQAGTIARNTSENVSIGRYLRYITYLNNEGYGSLNGKIDEVRISNAALSADWIRLCFMNQKDADGLVVFK